MDRPALGTASIVRANSRHLPIADDSVDLIVTSPPYFALRSYQDGGEHYEGQIGDEPTPAEFVESLLEVTRECVRVLKPSGSLWVNLGDKYSSGSGGQSNLTELGQRLGSGGGQKQDSAKVRSAPAAGFRPKTLLGIPWRYALRCIDDLGLILRAEVIWSKPNGLPESVTDRVRRSHEQWFHFTLSPRYFSAVDEIRETTQGRPGLTWDERKNRDDSRARYSEQNGHGGSGGMADNPLGKLPGSVWTVPTQPLRVPEHLGVDHFAAFPMEWPRRIIQGWSPSGVCVECGEGRRPVVARSLLDAPGGSNAALSNEQADDRRSGTVRSMARGMAETTITGYVCGCIERRRAHQCPSDGSECPDARCDATFAPPPTRPAIVLDPFGGTGTTALVAKALGRHGISVDMSADYCRLAEWRTNDECELARALQVEKPAKQVDGQGSLLDLLGEATA